MSDNKLFLYDEEFRKNYNVIVGVDEAGRGPLCGPVACAAVILKPEFTGDGINDSKKLTEKKREELFDIIIQNSLAYNITLIDEKTIDEKNILNATLLGMETAVTGLNLASDLVLIDGNKVPSELEDIAVSVVKGDANSLSIAAASILAKVTRDRYITEIAKDYPEYNLEKHKGYGTKAHYEALEKYGVPSFYRKTFLKKRSDLVWIEK